MPLPAAGSGPGPILASPLLANAYGGAAIAPKNPKGPIQKFSMDRKRLLLAKKKKK